MSERIHFNALPGQVRSDGGPPMTDDLDALPTQADVYDWAAARFPDLMTIPWRAMKLAEEAGEVVGAVVKMHDGTERTTLVDVEQETAQVVICAMALAESAGFDLWEAVAAEFKRVSP